jgi:hypothetical protein
VKEADYTVYVWLASTSVGAEVVVEVSASSVNAAVEKVLIERNIPFASYVWVVPADELEDCAERFEVELSAWPRTVG